MFPQGASRKALGMSLVGEICSIGKVREQILSGFNRVRIDGKEKKTAGFICLECRIKRQESTRK